MNTAPQSPISVLLVDDHPFIGRGIRDFLATKRDIALLGHAATSDDALTKVQQLQPDIVVMDISLQGEYDGFDTIDRIQAAGLHPGFVILSMSDDNEQHLDRFVGSAAKAYVLKQNPPEELYTAIKSVYRGQTFLSHQVSTAIVRHLKERKRSESLTDKELKVARLTALGYTSKEIGEKLAMSPRTVEKHREDIMHKWDAHSIADITRIAVQRKLIDG